MPRLESNNMLVSAGLVNDVRKHSMPKFSVYDLAWSFGAPAATVENSRIGLRFVEGL